ncbi:MAG: glycoside hydrolase family 16 protein [Acetobacteraceae bacterium]|nr:glycoside hydrolase family 16 protein [Acetobacteraceae bacterium]
MKLVFDDEFHELSISAHGPSTTWTAHTPWNGDFGDAAFMDPMPGFPFTLTPNGLRIEMRKLPDGHWQSGLISSTDPAGNGFTRRYGYFEINTKLPAGPGIWPAFWLAARVPADSPDPGLEIDVFEHYGKFPANYNTTVTLWPKPGHESEKWYQMKVQNVAAGSLSERFHTYGVKVDPTWITFYFDRKEYWRIKTPAQHKYGLGILADLGLGSGWPIDQTPNPCFMDIRYIRVYEDPSVADANK